MINKSVLILAIFFLGSTAFADVQVIDDSQNYAFNHHQPQIAPNRNNDNSVFVLSEKENSKPLNNLTANANTGNQKLQLLLSKIEQLQQEMSELRGVVEVQTHKLEMAGLIKSQMQSEHKTIAPARKKTVVIDSRAEIIKPDNVVIKTLSQVKDNTVKTNQIRRSDDPMDEQLSYVAAYEHVKHKHYEKAIPAMQSFIMAYPNGPYAANAHYWLGELYLVKSKTNKAKVEFETIIRDFADSNKLASAQYKLGVTYDKLGNKDEARAQFIKVTEEFPGTAIARLARTKLS
jgi:tol-pal system protein YbgF